METRSRHWSPVAARRMAPTKDTTQAPLARFILVDTIFSRVLVGACLFAGLFALGGMIREKNPDLAIPQAVVTAEWPGATPEQVEKSILAP